jgi:ArsR family transcriptional regulator
MKVLAEAGLVHREQRGRLAYFAIDQDALRSLASALSPQAG